MSDITITGKIAILGARGRQGGSVATALHRYRNENPGSNIRLRALTRNPETFAATWQQPTDETVRCDLNHPDTIGPALADVDYLFVVTDFWQHHSAIQETSQHTNLIQAIQKMSRPLQGVVLSTLENPPTPHELHSYRGKSQGREHWLSSGIPTVCVYPCFFWDDLVNLFPLYQVTPDPDHFTWGFPMEAKQQVAGMCLADLGELVVRVLINFNRYQGEHLRVCGEVNQIGEIHWYLQDMLRRYSDRQIKVELNTLSLDCLESGVSNELGNIFRYYQHIPGSTLRDSDVTRQVYPKTQCFYQWLLANRERLLSEYQLVPRDTPLAC